jgi:CheY-like chemotaxis protein
VTQPLALLLYEKLLPGTQVANRLQDLGWRVMAIHDSAALIRTAEEQKPLLVLADLMSSRNSVVGGIAHLRRNHDTAHIPVIAFTGTEDKQISDEAISSGATLVVTDTAILQHLSQFIDQALNEF